MKEIIELQADALAKISVLESKIYQLELQNEFLVHEFSNVRRVLHSEGITSYDTYLQTAVMTIGKILEESEVG